MPLQLTLPAHELGLLPDAMGVVAAVDLVGGHRHEVGRRQPQVGVDLNAGAQATEVAGVAVPALARDELEVELLAVGQADRLPGQPPELGRRVEDRLLDQLGRDRGLGEPAGVALAHVAFAG